MSSWWYHWNTIQRSNILSNETVSQFFQQHKTGKLKFMAFLKIGKFAGFSEKNPFFCQNFCTKIPIDLKLALKIVLMTPDIVLVFWNFQKKISVSNLNFLIFSIAYVIIADVMTRQSFFKNWFLRRAKISIELKLAEKVLLMTIYIAFVFWNFRAKIWCQLSIFNFFQLLTSLLLTSFIFSRFQT